MKDKKKWFIVGGIIAILIAGSLWFFLKGEPEKEPIKEIDTGLEDQSEAETEDEFAEDDNSPYEKLEGLNYSVLRTKFLGDLDKKPAFLMDVLVKKPFTESELSKLGEAVKKEVAKESDIENGVASIDLNVFTSKEAYEKTLIVNYKGEHIEGLVQKLTILTDEPSKSISTNYVPFSPSTDVEEMLPGVEFDVKNASIDSNGDIVQADVVLGNGSMEETQDTIAGLVSMLKETNKNVDSVNLRIYESEATYQKGVTLYEYSSLKPDVLIKQHQKQGD